MKQHAYCTGFWTGFGFEFHCECSCHNRKNIAADEVGKPDSVPSRTSTPEGSKEDVSNISQELKAKLNSLSAVQLRHTLRAAVLWIYQDIDFGHDDLFKEISKILKVRLAK